jgi:hypothetical protein
MLACAVACTPQPTVGRATTGETELTPAHCEVELDIFSGMPNPTWVLTDTEADSFVKQLDALPRTSAAALSGNLGYRGLIVHCTDGVTRSIHVQTGVVHISSGDTPVYAHDEDRELEKWLFDTGKPHLSNDVSEIVERELR